MLSNQAIKLRKRYGKLGSLVSAFAYDPDNVSKLKVWGQRKNLDFITGLQPKAKEAKKDDDDLFVTEDDDDDDLF